MCLVKKSKGLKFTPASLHLTIKIKWNKIKSQSKIEIYYQEESNVCKNRKKPICVKTKINDIEKQKKEIIEIEGSFVERPSPQNYEISNQTNQGKRKKTQTTISDEK